MHYPSILVAGSWWSTIEARATILWFRDYRRLRINLFSSKTYGNPEISTTDANKIPKINSKLNRDIFLSNLQSVVYPLILQLLLYTMLIYHSKANSHFYASQSITHQFIRYRVRNTSWHSNPIQNHKYWNVNELR